MRRLLGFVLAVAATACVAMSSAIPTPAPIAPVGGPDVQIVVAHDDSTVDVDPTPVLKDLAVMTALSASTPAEVMRCVARYSVAQRDGVTVYRIEQLAPAEVASATTENVLFYLSTLPNDPTLKFHVCGDSLPGLHSHVVQDSTLHRPSELDRKTMRDRGQPFNLLLSVVRGDSAVLHIYRP